MSYAQKWRILMRSVRKVLIGMLILLVVMAPVFSTGTQEKSMEPTVITMKLAGTTPASMENGEYDAMIKFAELVNEYSNGSINCEVYPANQLGTTAELAEGVSLGTIEGAVVGFDIIGNIDPSMNVMAMPYMFKDIDHQRLVLETDNPAGNLVKKSLQDNANMKLVGILHRGFRVLCNSKRPVYSTADMKGLEIRSPEAAANVATIEAMGGLPVTISWAEVFTSVSQGVCDGVENTITELYSINLQEVINYVSETNHLPAPIPIVVSNEWFNDLTQAQQDAILKAGQETTDYRFGTLTAEIKKAYKGMADAGVEILYADEIDQQSFRDACANVYKDFLKYFDEDLYQAILNAK